MGFTSKNSDVTGYDIDNHGCAAYGCPLPGSVSYGAGPGIKYYCRFHLGLSQDKFDAVTFRLNTHLQKIMELLKAQHDRQTHAPDRDKTVKGVDVYFAAERELRAVLLNDIDQSRNPPPPITPAIKGWKSASEYADGYQETSP